MVRGRSASASRKGSSWDLGELGLCTLEKRRLSGDFIAAFQHLKGAYLRKGDRLFTRVCSDRAREMDSN